MTTAHEDDNPALAKIRAARTGLRAVGPADSGADPPPDTGPATPRFQLTLGKSAPKSDPTHVRWLRGQLGHARLSWAFLRAGRTVRVNCIGEDGYREPAHAADDNGPATVAPLTGRVLSTRLADAFYCYVVRKTKEGEYETEEWFPEPDCDRALDQPEQLPYLRPLRGVTHTPLPRAGGGMITEPGYDAASGHLYQPFGVMPDVPTSPTPEQLDESVARVRGLVAEFSWAGDHDEANYVGALLTPLMRLVTPPPYKMLAVGAHQRGSGKSLLAQLLRIVHGGTLRSWPGTEEELGKQITSVLSQTTAPVCQIDNIRGLVRSAKLDALLTTSEYTDRTLGTTNDTTMTNDRLWVATGNNMVLGGDLDRRVVWVTIDPGVERPEDRTGFAIPDLAGHVTRNRAAILGDLLTMLAAWDAAGRPTEQPTADSFGVWVAAVRGVLGACGVPGVFDHADSRSDTVDPDAEEAAAFLAAVHDLFGDAPWTAKGITSAMREPAGVTVGFAKSEEDIKGATVAEAYPTAARGKFWRSNSSYTELTKPLGYWLRHREGQWFGGLRVEKASRGRGGAEYRVAQAQGSGVAQ